MRTPRKRPQKFTNSARVTLATLSVLSFIGGWNLIGRLEQAEAQTNEPSAPPPPTPTSLRSTPTPWPTILPLADIPAVPTLLPTLTTSGQQKIDMPAVEVSPINLAPLPALAPLPTLAPLPQMPVPPPPPPPVVNNHSGGS